MKIILSRKGFDSANGGIVSPIFEDGTLMSFPIPDKKESDDTYDDLVYGSQSYREILSNLHFKDTSNYRCHVDPDLDCGRRKEIPDGWVPIFGQINSSARYLLRAEDAVQEGDIFLFFGNFHAVEEQNGKYKYKKKTGDFYQDNDLQIIWGYLQIGKIITNKDEQLALKWHPHARGGRPDNSSNVLFVAAEHLSFAPEMPGAGLLKFSRERVLTLEGANKATWKKNAVYDLDSILSKRKNLAKNPDDGIYYAGIWQELKLKESDQCEEWAKSIIIGE